uniref:Uncharacterized protein n=1 Tax=Dictyoglomus turgidum TaxID=513050 RepID=A0A7C3WVH1_9BACT
MADVYPELPPPDVEVVVTTTTVSPTVFKPTLPACIAGPCFQIVEVTKDGLPNSAAVLELPAILAAGKRGDYTVSSPASFGFKVNGSAEVTVEFSNTTYTASQVASLINDALKAAKLDNAAIAEVITVGTGSKWQIRTLGTGTNKSIEITTIGSGLGDAFGIHLWRVTGTDKYYNLRYKASPFNFPAPRDNLDELVFDPNHVTYAIDKGGNNLTTLSTDSTVERVGSGGLSVVEDGDYDGYSPILKLSSSAVDEFGKTGTNIWKLSAAAGPASVTGSTAITSPADVNGKALIMSVSGSPYQVITFSEVDEVADIVAQINAVFPDIASQNAGVLTLSTDGIDDTKLSLSKTGREAYIHIHPTTPNELLQVLDPGASPTIGKKIYMGSWYPVQVNDEFYKNGELVGVVTRIVQVDLTNQWTIFEISNEIKQEDISSDKWYFVSKNLPGDIVSGDHPTPDVYITADGEIHIKQMVIRDSNGVPFIRYLGANNTQPVIYGQATQYVGYKALRKDVSPAAKAPELLEFNTVSEIEDEIGPITTDNPLAYGCWLAKMACPSRTLYAIGVEEISSNSPMGTATAYSKVMDFLASFDVYTIVPMTQDLDILQAWNTHVQTMSNVDNKLERCCFGTIGRPERGPNSVLVSGTDGKNESNTEFNTNIPGLTSILQDQGINVNAADWTNPDQGVYLDIESTSKHYHIKSASGSIVTIQTEAGSDFYSDTDFTGLTLITESFAVKKRGALLVDSSGKPDKDAISRAIADTAKLFAHKRFILGYAESVIVSDNGITMEVPAYYAACVEAGKRAEVLPHIGFTNTTCPGILGVKGTADYFSTKQLNVMAGGGVWIWMQKTPSSPVITRHQLTTDVTTIENREWSLTAPLDYLAKIIRLQIRPLLGKFNIDDNLLRLVDAILDGIRTEVKDNQKIFADIEFGELKTEEGHPDTLIVEVPVVRIYPFNKLRAIIIV